MEGARWRRNGIFETDKETQEEEEEETQDVVVGNNTENIDALMAEKEENMNRIRSTHGVRVTVAASVQ